MLRAIFAAAIALVFTLSSSALAQEAPKKEVKKTEVKGTLKSVTCDPACGFSVRSHDEKEVVAIVKEHAKTHHNMDMTDDKVKEMMKEEKMVEKKVEVEEPKEEED
jgi:predicted small metal-binding protein